MIVAVHQPQYLPWLGFFDKMDHADVFCFLDNVQYKKNEWQNRNRLKTSRGWQWLTVPVHYRFPQKINEVTIDCHAGWEKKHFQAMLTNYGGARYFRQYKDFFEKIYNQEWKYLSELNILLIEGICGFLGLNRTKFVRSSTMDLREDPSDRLIDICLRLGADTYLAGAGGAGYMAMERFEERGIKVLFQKFQHPIYPQLFGEFQMNLSVIDLLMNCGPESLAIIRNAQP